MKTLVRAAVVMSGAAGLCFAFALVAHADVGNPASTYQSAFKIAQMQQPVPVAAKPAAPAATKPDPTSAQAPAGRDEPVATPVPEQFVSEAPAPVVSRRQSSGHGSAVAGIVFGAEAKYREIEAFFGRVASAPQGGPGGGAGVPVLVLAFLSVATALNRHRMLGNRWVTDENALELLYARELTPPG